MQKTRNQLLKMHRYVAPNGNQFWKGRKVHGIKKKIKGPEYLWNEACKYFDWCEENPLYFKKYLKCGGEIIEVEEQRMRPYSIEGLCIHLGVTRQTFLNYSKKETYRDYFEVCELIRDVIFDHNLCGALVRSLKPCVVARELSMRTTQV